MAKTTGNTLEALVRKSAKAQLSQGLRLAQTSPRSVVLKRHAAGQAHVQQMPTGELDFVGDYKGRAVSFDAKSTATKTTFPLRNIKRHQATIVRHAHERGALAFFLVEFTACAGAPRYYALTWDVLAPFWSSFSLYQATSIPLAVFEKRCVEVVRKGATLDLVGAVQQLLEVAA